MGSFSHAGSYPPPALILAKPYKDSINLNQYWVSEKLDGVRAYWNGQQFISRQGNPYAAPDWFTREFPTTALDGELWLARGRFQKLLSIVSKDRAVDAEWQQVRYHVFDLPHMNQPFTQRIGKLQQLVKKFDSPYLIYVKQFRLPDKIALKQELKRIVAEGGEGLMLHRGDAPYRAGRTNDLLKLKPYYDAEATVISHIPGKGKYTGMLGSLLVTTPEGIQFRIGTGFTDLQRGTPPSIGSRITYTYHGKTNQGIPRFASFLRIRKSQNSTSNP